jgi:hypothetical protein
MQKTTVTRLVEDVPKGDAEAPTEDQPAPLFDLGGKEDSIAWIDIDRIEPFEEEGFLAKIGAESTQADIRARWGGGKYKLTAKGATGKYIQARTIQIAGDPRFMSKANAARWRRGQNVDDEDDAPMMLQQPLSSSPAFDPMQLMQMQMQAAREERDARRVDDRERDERRAREDRDAEERRRKADQESEDRRRKEDEASRERERQHSATMMQMLTARPEGGGAAEVVAMLVKGIELGRGMGGGRDDDEDGDDDDSLAGVIKEAVKGVAGGFMEGRRTHQRPAAGNPGAPPADTVRLTGPLAAKVKKLAALAKAKGMNPDEMLDGTVGKLVEAVEAAQAGDDEADEKTNPETPAAKKPPKPKAPAKQKKPTGDK